MRYLWFLIFIVFLFQGCNSTSKVEVRTIPDSAKIYDYTTKKLMGKSPFQLTYIFDSDPNTPKCEILPPLTAVWDGMDAIITKKDVIVCPNKEYIVTINQNTFKEPDRYKIVRDKEDWRVRPYLGAAIISSRVDFNIGTTYEIKSNSSTYQYRFGFIDSDNNRMELSTANFTVDEKSLRVSNLDTIVSIKSLKEKNITPYFKFGLGTYSYSYANKDYSSMLYDFGLGVFGDINDSIELELGIMNQKHMDHNSIGKKVGFNNLGVLDSEFNMFSVIMGFNYKF